MGFNDGEILLDSEAGFYIAGQTLHGKLQFQQAKVKTFRGIYVQIKGQAHVHWTTSHTRRRDGRSETYTVNHNAEEEYFRVKEYLVGGPSGEHHLQKGDHEFPFQCHIPPHCPSSYDGTYGYVKYKIKVVVDRALKVDQEKEREFEVRAPLDLKAHPYCREPLLLELEDPFCSWCMSAGVCQTVVKLPQSGFCVGKTVPLELSCVNDSSVNIKKIKLQIVKKTTFHAHSAPGTKRQQETIIEMSKGSVPGGTRRAWNLELQIPVMDPCNLDGCRIIDVEYYFEVKVKTSGLHFNSEESRRIIIGDEPLDDVVTTEDEKGDRTSQTNQPLVQNDTHASYPMSHAPYTQTPLVNYPYPPGNSSNPSGNALYTGGNMNYPGGNSPYPGANSPTPYPAGNIPYPGANHPAGNSLYPGGNTPYPSAGPGNVPYPISPSGPYGPGFIPGGNQAVITPYPGSIPMPLPTDPSKPPSNQFRMPNEDSKNIAGLPPPGPTSNAPTSPYVGASAPAMADDESSDLATPAHLTPYNPQFMKENK